MVETARRRQPQVSFPAENRFRLTFGRPSRPHVRGKPSGSRGKRDASVGAGIYDSGGGVISIELVRIHPVRYHPQANRRSGRRNPRTVADVGGHGVRRRPDIGRAIGGDGYHGGGTADARPKPRARGNAAYRHPGGAAILGPGGPDVSVVIQHAHPSHHERIQLGKVYGRDIDHEWIQIRCGRNAEVVMPEAALVPNRAEQVSAGWRTDHQANHGFFDSIRSHVPVSGLSGIHLGQIIGGPHGVAGVIEGVVGIERIDFERSVPHSESHLVIQKRGQRGVAHGVLLQASPGRAAVGAAEKVVPRPPAVPGAHHDGPIALSVHADGAVAVPQVNLRVRRRDIGPGSIVGVELVDRSVADAGEPRRIGVGHVQQAVGTECAAHGPQCLSVGQSGGLAGHLLPGGAAVC